MRGLPQVRRLLLPVPSFFPVGGEGGIPLNGVHSDLGLKIYAYIKIRLILLILISAVCIM